MVRKDAQDVVFMQREWKRETTYVQYSVSKVMQAIAGSTRLVEQRNVGSSLRISDAIEQASDWKLMLKQNPLSLWIDGFCKPVKARQYSSCLYQRLVRSRLPQLAGYQVLY